MESYPDQQTLEQVKRLAQSPLGKHLMELARKSGSDDIKKAQQQAAAGNLDQAKQTLSGLLQTPEFQKLLKEMEKRNG